MKIENTFINKQGTKKEIVKHKNAKIRASLILGDHRAIGRTHGAIGVRGHRHTGPYSLFTL